METISLGALFILVPLTLLLFLIAVGTFESDGGIERLKAQDGSIEKVILWPFTNELGPDYGRHVWLLQVPLLLMMSVMGYAQRVGGSSACTVACTAYAIAGCATTWLAVYVAFISN
jgi:hypothetical protein